MSLLVPPRAQVFGAGRNERWRAGHLSHPFPAIPEKPGLLKIDSYKKAGGSLKISGKRTMDKQERPNKSPRPFRLGPQTDAPLHMHR